MTSEESVERKPKIAVSCDMKINLGNYESAGGSCMLSGIDADATDDDILAMLDTADMAFNLIRLRLKKDVEAFKASR